MRFSLALLLAGCRCPTFAEMEVVDLTLRADPGFLEEIRSGIDQFAAWNGGEGVCVPRVEVVAQLTSQGHDLGGRYRGRSRPILVDGDLFGSPRAIILHELCHAADEELGEISVERADLFPGDSDALNPDLYETPRERQNEHFADLCQEGPSDAVLLEAVGEVCGEDLLGEASALIRDRIYPQAVSELRGTTPVALEDRRMTIPTFAELYLLDVTGLRSSALALGWEHTRYGTGEVIAMEIDASTGEMLRRIRIDLPEGWNFHQTDWIPHPDAPLLRLDDRAYLRFDAEDGALVPFDLPEPPPGSRGFPRFAGDDLWIAAERGELWRKPVAAGGWTAEPLPPVPEGAFLALGPAADGFLLAVWTPDEAEIWRWTDGGWQGPAPLPEQVSMEVGLADGRILGRWYAWSSETDVSMEGLAVYDPETGAWAMSDDPCGADAPQPASRYLLIGDEPWLWSDWYDPEEGLMDRTLTRVILE